MRFELGDSLGYCYQLIGDGDSVVTVMPSAGIFHIWSADDGNVFCCAQSPAVILHFDWVKKVDPASLCHLCVVKMREHRML
jgi:hypothetical protein